MRPRPLMLTMLALIIMVSVSVTAFAEVAADGKTEFELGFSYSHFSKNKLIVNGYSLYDVIIIGQLKVDEIRRDIFIPSLTIRRSLSPNASFQAVVPFRMRIDDILSYTNMDGEGPTVEVIKGGGLGDVELALNIVSKVKDAADTPWITTLGVKAPTGLDPYSVTIEEVPLGTGHWGARVGFSKTKTIDPVVVFGGVGYFWNVERTLDTYGAIDPGDTIQYSFGAAYALNQKFSVNAKFEHMITSATTVNGKAERRSAMNAASVGLGASYVLDDDTSMDVTVSIGLTEDAPDFTLRFSWPL